jgi:DUF2075 family protein
MVYSWDDKEAICYQLYVEERRSLEEVMSYWEIRGFTPRYASIVRGSTHGLPYAFTVISNIRVANTFRIHDTDYDAPASALFRRSSR